MAPKPGECLHIEVSLSVCGDTGEVELIPKTTLDQQMLDGIIGTSETAKIKKNGTTKFILPLQQQPIGRASLNLDSKDDGRS